MFMPPARYIQMVAECLKNTRKFQGLTILLLCVIVAERAGERKTPRLATVGELNSGLMTNVCFTGLLTTATKR